MAVVSPRLTYEDLLETPDDGKRYEIIDGELFVSASPFPPHQRASWNLSGYLMEAERAGLGTGFTAPIDVYLDQYSVVVPDLVFILKDRTGIVTESKIEGSPDIVIEILSPSTRKRDIGIKMQLYARFGVPWYYVVDAKTQTVQPYRLVEGAYRAERLLTAEDELACPLLPGVSTPVAALFR